MIIMNLRCKTGLDKHVVTEKFLLDSFPLLFTVACKKTISSSAKGATTHKVFRGPLLIYSV